MAISNVQQGVITEAEFAKICILTSNGRLIPTRALADDDRRDFEITTRSFTDPVFLVPSPFFHKHALHGVGRGAIQLQFKASMEPNAKDMWAPWALPQAELGQRVLDMLRAQPAHSRLDAKVEQLIAMSG